MIFSRRIYFDYVAPHRTDRYGRCRTMADLIRHRIHHRQYIVAMFSFSDRCTDLAAKIHLSTEKSKLFFDAVQDKRHNMLPLSGSRMSKQQQTGTKPPAQPVTDPACPYHHKGRKPETEHFTGRYLKKCPAACFAWDAGPNHHLPTVLPSLLALVQPFFTSKCNWQ